jgi:transcriptional regulator with XRE-family HTH domain
MPRSKPASTVFGKRMRESRLRRGIAQDRLGVLLGLDESSSSSRISRYETGTHAPPLPVAEKIAELLGVPLASLYCEDDELSAFIEDIASLDDETRQSLRMWLDKRLAKRKEGER